MRTRYFQCARCDAQIPDFLTFGARGRYYCLHHIPWLTRVRMWLRERRGR